MKLHAGLRHGSLDQDDDNQAQVTPRVHDDFFDELEPLLLGDMGLDTLGATTRSSPSESVSAQQSLQIDLSNVALDAECCWGLRLKQLWGKAASEQPPCEPGFRRGEGHMKNKFCANCRLGMDIPASHCRVLTPEFEAVFLNSTTEGFWASTTGKFLRNFRAAARAGIF